MDLRLQRMVHFKTAVNYSITRDFGKYARHRNTLLPIGNLPAELLLFIFNLHLFTPRGRRKSQFVSRITKLRAVSWFWRDLIGRTPSFWAHVSSEDHMDFVFEALERSDGFPLHLKHIGKSKDGPESPFLDKVLPHAHRWESAAIHQPNAHVAAKYFSASAPKIKVVLLSSLLGSLPQEEDIDSPFGGELPNLEELRVEFWGNMSMEGIRCTRLRVLDIERQFSLDMDAVLYILAANPYLRILRLHNLLFNPYPQPDPIPAPIPLNHLTQLTLTNIGQVIEDTFSVNNVAICDLLQRIRFPTGIAFSFRTNLQTDPPLSPEKLINLIPNPVEALDYASPVDGVQRADVDIKFGGSDFGFRIQLQDGTRCEPAFSVEVDGLPGQVAREWVMAWLLQPSRMPMDLRLYFGRESSESTFSLEEVFYFQLWESVVDLTLTGNAHTSSDVGREFLRLLSTPCMSEGGIMVMPFPQLQHLRIFSVPKIKGRDMLAMVQSRFAPPGSTEAASHSVVPAPLTVHCGNGIGSWGSSYQDRLMAVPGVEGIRTGATHLAPWGTRSSYVASSEPEWPPPYDYGGFVGY